MSKSKRNYEELRTIAEHCFLFPQLSTMNEEFVGEFMFNHEAVAATFQPQEDRKARSDRTLQIMEDVNKLTGLLSLGDMTLGQVGERIVIGRARMDEALASVTISGKVLSYMDEKLRYLTLAEK